MRRIHMCPGPPTERIVTCNKDKEGGRLPKLLRLVHAGFTGRNTATTNLPVATIRSAYTRVKVAVELLESVRIYLDDYVLFGRFQRFVGVVVFRNHIGCSRVSVADLCRPTRKTESTTGIVVV